MDETTKEILSSIEKDTKKRVQTLRGLSSLTLIMALFASVFFVGLILWFYPDDKKVFSNNLDLIYNILPKLTVFTVIQILIYNFFRIIRNNLLTIKKYQTNLDSIRLIHGAIEITEGNKEPVIDLMKEFIRRNDQSYGYGAINSEPEIHKSNINIK